MRDPVILFAPQGGRTRVVRGPHRRAVVGGTGRDRVNALTRATINICGLQVEITSPYPANYQLHTLWNSTALWSHTILTTPASKCFSLTMATIFMAPIIDPEDRPI